MTLIRAQRLVRDLRLTDELKNLLTQFKAAPKLFLFLLALDVVLILLHVGHQFVSYYQRGYRGWLSKYDFAIWAEWGYGEMFQYSKEACLIGLFLFLLLRSRQVLYAGWLILFGYILADDSMRLHEKMGRYLAREFELPSILGLRPQDLGELGTFLTVGLLALSLIAMGYYYSQDVQRRRTWPLLGLFGALAFVGVPIDMLDRMVGGHKHLAQLLFIIEDGGEMVIMSALVWYGFRLLALVKNAARTEPLPLAVATSPQG